MVVSTTSLTSEKVQYSVGRVEHTRIQPNRQDTKQPISMYITTILCFMVSAGPQVVEIKNSQDVLNIESTVQVWTTSHSGKLDWALPLCHCWYVRPAVLFSLTLSFRRFCLVSILYSLRGRIGWRITSCWIILTLQLTLLFLASSLLRNQQFDFFLQIPFSSFLSLSIKKNLLYVVWDLHKKICIAFVCQKSNVHTKEMSPVRTLGLNSQRNKHIMSTCMSELLFG